MLTLLTDFGYQDSYVAVMKGIIAQINPTVPVVDLTHGIPPQDIAAGRFNLMCAIPYFPAGSIHVAIVDPGVGSQRRGIAIHCEAGFLVGPDNGLWSGVLTLYPALSVVSLTNSRYWRTPTLSQTFHGRDVFAPAAAHLSRGVPLPELGSPLDPAELMPWSLPDWHPSGDPYFVQYIDSFGNLITNIPAAAVTRSSWQLEAGGERIPSGSSYAESAHGALVSLIGSHGWIEIAVNGGNAQQRLGVTVGSPVRGPL